MAVASFVEKIYQEFGSNYIWMELEMIDLKADDNYIKISIEKKTLILVIALSFILISLFFLKKYHITNLMVTSKVTKIDIKIKRMREPAVAGSFYPADKNDLERMLTEFLNDAKEENFGKVKGLVVPHAGYIYSGSVAAKSYKQLYGADTVIIIVPSHHVRFKGASVPNYTHYKTPLGEIKISDKAKDLIKEDLIVSLDEVHKKEHSVEVQLPFLQKVLGNFEILPIVTGDINPQQLANILLKYIDNNTVIIASSDLSHYYPYERAVKLDSICIEAIPHLDFENMDRCEACGKIPILTLMYISKELKLAGSLIDYKNSGDTVGTRESVVGYAAIAFFEGVDDEEQQFLLNLSRLTLEEFIKNGNVPSVDERDLSERLKRVQGCFVTLEKHGMLRGCIGHIIPQKPLYKCVIENTINAAINDRRFVPVGEDELKDIEIEISVLSLPKKVEFKDSSDLISKLTPLKDGVVIREGSHQATYLPQVWDQFDTKESFLYHLCLKAGLSEDCWKSRSIEIETYSAQVFKEHQPH